VDAPVEPGHDGGVWRNKTLTAIMPFCPCFARRSNDYFAFPEVKKKAQ
jgi:hypothetical protein